MKFETNFVYIDHPLSLFLFVLQLRKQINNKQTFAATTVDLVNLASKVSAKKSSKNRARHGNLAECIESIYYDHVSNVLQFHCASGEAITHSHFGLSFCHTIFSLSLSLLSAFPLYLIIFLSSICSSFVFSFHSFSSLQSYTFENILAVLVKTLYSIRIVCKVCKQNTNHVKHLD